MGQILKLLSSLFMCAALSSCAQIGYYYQAAKGQALLLSKRQPVTEILADPGTPEKLKLQLSKAQEIIRFAEQQLGLKTQGNFTQYADLGRKHAVWNVVAAPEFSIEPKTWCFPIAGCVAYKGFFEHDLALREQDKLRSLGYDVLVYGVSAYSTLGWFDDPLLNTFIHYPDNQLAALIFHELSHQVVYVKDDSEFNEAFATAVEYAMLERWLQKFGDEAQIDQITTNRSNQNMTTELVLGFREQLQTAYSGENPAREKMRLFGQMQQRYTDIKARGQGTRYYDWWFSQPLNNAYLLTVSTYFRLVPAFSRMISERDGDLPSFFNSVKTLARQSKQERDKALQHYLQL
ncbi:MAG: aminopeptidase [bacterium]